MPCCSKHTAKKEFYLAMFLSKNRESHILKVPQYYLFERMIDGSVYIPTFESQIQLITGIFQEIWCIEIDIN